MRGIIIGLILIAIAVAGGAAYLLRSYLSDQEAEMASLQESKMVEEVYVLVAKRDLPVGHVVTPENIGDSLAWQGWPATAIDPNYRMERQPGKDISGEYIGLTVRTPISAREPITPIKLFKKGAGGYLAGVLAPGMRSVTVAVNPVSAAQGFLFPGDHVDVMLYWTLTDQARGSLVGIDGQRLIDKRAAEIILRDIKVLAIDGFLDSAATQGAPHQATHVALEVTPKGAEILEVARNLGQISLTLRSLAKDTTELPTGPDSRENLTFTTDYEISPMFRNLPKAVKELSSRIAGPDGFSNSDGGDAATRRAVEQSGKAQMGGNGDDNRNSRNNDSGGGMVPDPVIIERVVEVERIVPGVRSAPVRTGVAPIRVHRDDSGQAGNATPANNNTVEITEEEINNPVIPPGARQE